MLIALDSVHGLIIHQMDIKTAFLHGELEEEVYMDQLEGFVASGNERIVCKVIKSIYGLKQAPRDWHKKFDETVLPFSYKINESDECVYTKVKGSEHFEMKDMGEASVILGIKLIQSAEGITLTQSHYIEKSILEKYGYSQCRIASTPYDSKVALVKNTSEVPVSQLRYSQIIGSLQYLANCTRPDISYFVSKLARYTSCPNRTYWDALDRVLRYLKGTMYLSLHYRRFPGVLEGYSDASWIAKKSCSNGVTGYVFTLAGGAISWKSSRQTIVTRSTFEAELCALDATWMEVEWLHGFMSAIPVISRPLPAIAIHCNSRTTIDKISSKKHNAKTKRHIQVRLKSIRGFVSDRIIAIEFIGTQNNIADPLTKGLEPAILEGLLRLPENRECADCKSIAPRWASVNLGIFICMRCSGIHRSLGVHISKVRSATLDTWLPDQIALIQSMGNAKANSYWESELPPNYNRAGIENFIRAKYNDKRWIPGDVKVTSSTRVRDEKLLITREVTTNTSDKEHVNSIPKSSDERDGSQLHNSNSKLLPSNSRNHVPQKVSKLEHQKSELQGLENGLEQRKSNTVAVVSPSKGDLETDLFTLLPVNNSEKTGQEIVAPGQNMKMKIQPPKKEETIVSKESESKIQVDHGFEDLFQGLQWGPQPISQESPKEVQMEKSTSVLGATTSAKQVEIRIDDFQGIFFVKMQAKFLKLDIEKFQNDISFLKEGMVAILTKMDSYSRKTTGPSPPAREDSQGLEQAKKSVHEIEENLNGIQANDRELKSDFQKIDFGKFQEDERARQQPPILEVLGQTPLNSNSGNNKEQETCLFDVSSPPNSSMDSLSQILEIVIFEGLKLEGGSLKAESYFDNYFELVNLSTPTKKPGVLSQLPTHHPQLATQSQEQHFPMANAAKINGVPQAGPGIINQLNCSDSHKLAQNWAYTIKSVPQKITQVADQPKFVQIGHVQPSYNVGNSASFTKLRSISGVHSDKLRMQHSEGSASPAIRNQTASTRSPIIPTQLGGDYDFSSLVQGMFGKR
ncbi:hypothetical protein AgCh_028119 [Apium graveolens]